MSHEELKEMIPAHALSALDVADDRLLNEHLTECGSCRHELDLWRASAASLALSVSPAEPSIQLRQRILTQVRAEKSQRVDKVVPFVAPRKNIWLSFGSLGAIAAMLIFAALIVSVLFLWKENQATRLQVATLQEELTDVKIDLALKTAAINLISAPDSHLAELNPTPMAPGATAKLAFDKTGHAMLLAQNLPNMPADKEYQLWFIVGDKKMPGRTFSIDSGGTGLLVDQVPEEAMRSAVFAVTAEPKGGVPSPTGPIYLVSRS